MAKKKRIKSSAKAEDDSNNESNESFEETLKRLESIVRDLEQGNLGLSDSLTRYEEGVRNLKRCHQLLNRAEQSVQVLLRLNESGAAETTNFDTRETFDRDDATSSMNRTSARSSSSTSKTLSTASENTTASENATGKLAGKRRVSKKAFKEDKEVDNSDKSDDSGAEYIDDQGSLF